jgi:hypothetical protein
MTEHIQTDSGARSMQRLSIPLWILCVLTLVNLCISVFGFLYPWAVARRIRASLHEGAPLPCTTYEDQYADFHEWPLEKQIEKATVIAIARYEKEDGRLKCVISEILKQTPDMKFYYKVGDEYRPGSHYMKDDVTYGDGVVMFFTGSPAMMRYACSFQGDRIAGFGDMPIETLRDTIGKTK